VAAVLALTLTLASALGLATGAVIATAGPLAIDSSSPSTSLPDTARVFALDDEVRLRRQDTDRARESGQALSPAASPTATVNLAAFRGETVAFQIAVVAGAVPLDKIALSLTGLPGGAGGPRAAIFRQHYLSVGTRSRNDRRPAESLGWLPAARPADDQMTGEIPDALLPIALDPAPVMPGPAVPAGRLGAFWVDIDVPEASASGPYHATGQVIGDGVTLARFALTVQVAATPLPYRATSAFVFYEAERLARRLGSVGAAERQLWRLLHAHHIDALAPLGSAGDVRRLKDVYDGSLFTPAPAPDSSVGADDVYLGPGIGVPPAVIALGAYGALGAPRPDSLKRVDEMLDALPPAMARPGVAAASIADVFVYAIDETCGSPRAGAWKQALAGHAAGRGHDPGQGPGHPLLVGQTCSDPPERQAVDIAMATAEGFPRTQPGAARAAGRRGWIYNGILPHTGTLMLDADPRGLMANGWIAAVTAIERWFYWESIFWDDDNRGGHGAVDPFATAESFHNADGDAALGDGLLLYPGRQQGPFAARSLGYEGVLPSLRLKQLRRGIQDAGIIALAAREHPADTARVVVQALPAALDEARTDGPPAWENAPLRFTEARAALRRLVTRADPMPPAQIAAAFEDQAARRRELVPLAPRREPPAVPRKPLAVGIVLAGALLLVVLLRLVQVNRRGTKHG
jgi:hypothetical protein